MNELELKIQALLEKIGSLTTNYENQIADLRVTMTVLSQKNEELEKKIAEKKEAKSTE